MKKITTFVTMFNFKRFTISDDNSAMKVGTDGVMLGAWAKQPQSDCLLLDIGCGSGIISLIMAQRTDGNITIDSVDLDRGAVCDSKQNFSLSPWSQSLNAICDNFVSYSMNCGKKYDMVVSNPPFFTETTLPPDGKRSAARNSFSLGFDELFKGVAHIIAPNGTFSLITPAESYAHLAQTALLNGFYLLRLTQVVTVEGTTPKRVLTEWSRVQTEYEIDTIVISNREGSYTAQYQKLVSDFYL